MTRVVVVWRRRGVTTYVVLDVWRGELFGSRYCVVMDVMSINACTMCVVWYMPRAAYVGWRVADGVV